MTSLPIVGISLTVYCNSLFGSGIISPFSSFQIYSAVFTRGGFFVYGFSGVSLRIFFVFPQPLIIKIISATQPTLKMLGTRLKLKHKSSEGLSLAAKGLIIWIH